MGYAGILRTNIFVATTQGHSPVLLPVQESAKIAIEIFWSVQNFICDFALSWENTSPICDLFSGERIFWHLKKDPGIP